MAKVPPWQLPGPAPQGASGGSGQLGTPGVRPSHGVPSHRPGGSSERPPKSPILLPLSVRHRVKSRRYRYRHLTGTGSRRYRYIPATGTGSRRCSSTSSSTSRYSRSTTRSSSRAPQQALLKVAFGLWLLAFGLWPLRVARCPLPVARCPLPFARRPLPLPALCCFPCHGSLRGLPAAHCSSPRLLHALRRRA